MKLLLLTLCVTIASCNCNWHIKRVKAKCGYTSDTVFKNVSVFVPEVSHDTIFKHSTTRDTLVMKSDRLTVKYFYNTHDSTVFLSGKCDSIVKLVKVPVIVNKYKESIGKWYWFLIILVGLIFVILLRKL